MIHVDEQIKTGGAERAILIGVWNRSTSREAAEEYLAELRLLVETAGAKIVGTYLQRMEKPNASTFIGKGKLEEISEAIQTHQVDLVVFDEDLSPSQVKNIDARLKIKVLDRSGIILHIFSENARTAQAKAQVELAHLQYMLPRLAGLWTHLSKQKGGIGLKGAGEKEIETDRRMIRRKIDLLRQKLTKIDKQNQTRRKQRGELVRVSLVGYTNVGKSTIMNLLSKSDILAQNKLFATLDTTVRKVVLDQVPFLLSDTVGFIRKLPHNLIECFKSTLDEARESDILVHVVDISSTMYEQQMATVKQTLLEIGVDEKPVLVVFNKIDALPEEEMHKLEESWMGRKNAPAVFVSAAEKVGIGNMRKVLLGMIRACYRDKYPYQKFGIVPEYEDQTGYQSDLQ